MNQLGGGYLLRNQVGDPGLRIVESGSLLHQLNRVALAVLRLQVVRRAEDHKPAVDHDSETVAELLSLVHTVRGEEHRGHVHFLDHTVKTAARDRINASCRLVKEENPWTEHKSLSTAEFSLVTATQVLTDGVLEEVQLECLHNQPFDPIPSLALDSFQTRDEVHTLIDSQHLPNQVLLVALSEEFAHLTQWEVLHLVPHQLRRTRSYRQLHRNHVERGRFACSVRAQQPENFAFARTECITADGHPLSSGIGLAYVDSLDLESFILFLKPIGIVSDLIFVVKHVLSHVKKGWGLAFLPATPSISITDAHVEENIESANDQ